MALREPLGIVPETESIRLRGIYLNQRAMSGLDLVVAFTTTSPGCSRVDLGCNEQPRATHNFTYWLPNFTKSSCKVLHGQLE